MGIVTTQEMISADVESKEFVIDDKKPVVVEKEPVLPISQVARNFQTNAIDNDLKSCPGIGPAGVRHLNEQNVNTTEHLVGRFFMCDRDEVKFIEWLEDAGVKNQFARECAENFKRKFGSI
jgi:predicted flap endonuclease-1-like 5' DNA nuclease